MKSAKQKEVKVDSAQPELDPEVVIATLYERIHKDCTAAMNYLTITELIGVLEVTKMSLFTDTHLAAAKQSTEVQRQGATIN